MGIINQKNKKSLLLIFVCLLFMGTAGVADVRSEIIGTADLAQIGGRNYIANGSVLFDLHFNEGGSSFDKAILFNDLALNASDIGNVYTVTEANNTDFNYAVELLTNNLFDGVSICVSLLPVTNCGQEMRSEAYRFFGDDTGANGIDFNGYTINSISFVLDELSFDIPGRDPNSDGNWTDYTFRGTLLIDGAVSVIPEPISSTMFIVGGATLGFRYFRKRK